ncbi:MAG: hypothetical protein WKF61_12125 [Luteimonas sp.]
MQAFDLLSDVAKGYCTEYGRQARDLFRDETWDAIEPRIRQCWQNNHPQVDWEVARGRIEAEWWRHSAEV